MYANDFDSWVDLLEMCRLQMANSRMKKLREIVEGNLREELARVRPAAQEQPGGQVADAVRAELKGAAERSASPGASEAHLNEGSEEEEGKAVYVCPICTVPMGSRRSLQSHLPTCVKAKGALSAAQRQCLLKLQHVPPLLCRPLSVHTQAQMCG